MRCTNSSCPFTRNYTKQIPVHSCMRSTRKTTLTRHRISRKINNCVVHGEPAIEIETHDVKNGPYRLWLKIGLGRTKPSL